MRDAVRTLGIEIRVGLHTGEVKTVGEDLAGIAVHIGARVSAAARPGEVLVSRTVADLVAGSGIRFRDRGVHLLKGIPGNWQLFDRALIKVSNDEHAGLRVVEDAQVGTSAVYSAQKPVEAFRVELKNSLLVGISLPHPGDERSVHILRYPVGELLTWQTG